jgi:hypothetical protein
MIGLYSETNTNPVLSYSQIINSAIWGGNNTTPNEISTAVTPLDGSVVLQALFLNSGQTYGGIIFDIDAGQDISAYTTLKFGIDASGIATFADIKIQLEDGIVSPGVFLSAYTPTVSANWKIYEIPLSDFNGVDLTRLTYLGFWNASSVAGAEAPLVFGPLYFDDIHFTDAGGTGGDGGGSGGVTGELVSNGGFDTGDLSDYLTFLNGGTVTAVDSAGVTGLPGDYAARLVADVDSNGGAASFPILKVERLGEGLLPAGPQPVTVSFDLYGSSTPNGVMVAEFFSERAGDNGAVNQVIPGVGLPTGTWTNYSFDLTTGSDIGGGVSLLFKADCGGNTGCIMDAYIDNVSIIIGSAVP